MRVDISRWTCKLSTAAPSRAAALMKSRSEKMPTGFIHRSSTIKARWCTKPWESTVASSGLASSWHAEVSGTRRGGMAALSPGR